MEQNMVLKLMRVREGAIIPKQATAGSAGYDLCACMDAPQTIEPGERCVFPSGLAAEIPAGTAGFVFTRSGLGIKKGIHVTNGVGVIDSDYRGEIQIGLHNLSAEPYTVQPGERIAQMKRVASGADAECVFISALTGDGMDEFAEKLEGLCRMGKRHINVLLPADKGSLMGLIYKDGENVEVDYRNNGIFVSLMCNEKLRAKLAQYETAEDGSNE